MNQGQVAFQTVPQQLPGGFDFGALLQAASVSQAQMPQQVVAQTAVVPQVKTTTKKKAPSAQEKREKNILDILDGKDKFSLKLTSLLFTMDQAELQAYIACVKAKHGRQ